MQSTKKLFAAVSNACFRVMEPAIEISNEAEAVQKTLQLRGIFFTTYEIETITLNGKDYKGAPENGSPHRYVGVDRVYSRDEVVASMENDLKKCTSFRDQFIFQAIRRVIDVYNSKYSADSVHITGLERDGEFIDLKPGDKVFDKTGRQLWPKLSAPASVPGEPKPTL